MKGRIRKNFEAEGWTEWKSKKKVYTFADVLFSQLKIGEKQNAAADVPFFTDNQQELNKKKKRSLA